MSVALRNIERLRRFATGDHERGSDAEWIAERIKKYTASAGALSLDEALEVGPKRGAWPWWREEKRNLARAAATELIDAVGSSKSAYQFLRRYAAGRGRFAGNSSRDSDPRAKAARDFIAAVDGRIPESAKTLTRAANRGTSDP